jgi:hypothetical protein
MRPGVPHFSPPLREVGFRPSHLPSPPLTRGRGPSHVCPEYAQSLAGKPKPSCPTGAICPCRPGISNALCRCLTVPQPPTPGCGVCCALRPPGPRHLHRCPALLRAPRLPALAHRSHDADDYVGGCGERTLGGEEKISGARRSVGASAGQTNPRRRSSPGPNPSNLSRISETCGNRSERRLDGELTNSTAMRRDCKFC